MLRPHLPTSGSTPRTDPPPSPLQALKANAEAAPSDLKLNSNYITRFGQVSVQLLRRVADMHPCVYGPTRHGSGPPPWARLATPAATRVSAQHVALEAWGGDAWAWDSD